MKKRLANLEELEKILNIEKACSLPVFEKTGEESKGIVKQEKWQSFLFFFDHLRPLYLYHPAYTAIKVEKIVSPYDEEKNRLWYKTNATRHPDDRKRIRKEKVMETIEGNYMSIYGDNWKRKFEKEKKYLFQPQYKLNYIRKLDSLPKLVAHNKELGNMWTQIFVSDDKIISGYDSGSLGRMHMQVMVENMPENVKTHVYLLDKNNKLVLKKVSEKLLVYNYYTTFNKKAGRADFNDVIPSYKKPSERKRMIRIKRIPAKKSYLKQLLEYRFKISFEQKGNFFYCSDSRNGKGEKNCVFSANLGTKERTGAYELVEFLKREPEMLHFHISKEGYCSDALHYAEENSQKLRLLYFYEDI